MSFVQVMEWVTRLFEGAGVLVLVAGFAYAALRWVFEAFTGRLGANGFTDLRNRMGGTILLALEVLVAADIVRTLAVDPTVQNVAVLGLIVLIRTFLSFSLEVEMDGMWPWQRAKVAALAENVPEE